MRSPTVHATGFFLALSIHAVPLQLTLTACTNTSRRRWALVRRAMVYTSPESTLSSFAKCWVITRFWRV